MHIREHTRDGVDSDVRPDPHFKLFQGCARGQGCCGNAKPIAPLASQEQNNFHSLPIPVLGAAPMPTFNPCPCHRAMTQRCTYCHTPRVGNKKQQQTHSTEVKLHSPGSGDILVK